MFSFKNVPNALRVLAGLPSAGDDFWYDPIPGYGKNTITADSASKITAVYACVQILADSLATLPLHLYERVSRGKNRATTHNLYKILRYSPNAYQTAFDFWALAVWHLCLRGVFYAKKVTKNGRVIALEPINPDTVIVEKINAESLGVGIQVRYVVTSGAVQKRYFAEEIFRVNLFTESDGVTPVSPIARNADTIVLSKTADEYTRAFVDNNSTPAGTLTTSNKLSQESMQVIRRSWERAYRGAANAGKVAVLDQDLKFLPISVSNRDAQLLEARQFQLNQICRIFKVPPHLVQDLTRSTFSNIEHQSLDFVTHTLRPWAERIEQAVYRDLLLPEEKDRYFAEYLFNDLLAADAMSRGQFYSTMLQSGVLTPNEVREKENLNPLPGLDKPFRPLNMGEPSEGATSPEENSLDDENEDANNDLS